MLGSEIKTFFRNHPVLRHHLKGVYAADQLRWLRLPDKSFAICNTDTLDGGEGGKHWWCLAKVGRRFGNDDSTISSVI
jgi:hypothetical protein